MEATNALHLGPKAATGLKLLRSWPDKALDILNQKTR